MALVLFGLTDHLSPDLQQSLDNAVDLAIELQETLQSKERVSIVAMKYDLVPREWSGVNLYLARKENQLIYPDDILLHKVSSTTGEGIDNLRNYMGKWKSSVSYVLRICVEF